MHLHGSRFLELHVAFALCLQVSVAAHVAHCSHPFQLNLRCRSDMLSCEGKEGVGLVHTWVAICPRHCVLSQSICVQVLCAHSVV
jgi:hypothetical protein